MFTVELGGKKYTVPKVTARTLRDIGGAQAVFKKWTSNPDSVDMKKDMDTLVGWFCVLCGNQFTPDEIYDNYPGDKIITDIGIAMAAVNGQATSVLEKFPSGDGKKKAHSKTWFSRFTGILLSKGASRKK
jgi:hypothetical protein